ncbi:MAG: hypothetical protein H6Q55_3208, partial [Deltaproteobacteria bacterium]|nr:hypothetical protein [Deltaproteobacteria bacterium]
GHLAEKMTMPIGGQAIMDATKQRILLGPSVR